MKLAILVQPRASMNEVAGWQGEVLKVRLSAPPVDGEANAALVAFLAKSWKLKKAQIAITSGHRGRRKTLEITGVESADFLKSLWTFPNK